MVKKKDSKKVSKPTTRKKKDLEILHKVSREEGFSIVMKYLKPIATGMAKTKASHFENGIYAGDFNDIEMNALAEDTAMEVARRVMNWVENPNHEQGVESKGMFNYFRTAFDNQCKKRYEKIAKTEKSGSAQAISSDEALAVAASKNLLYPERTIVLEKEFEYIIKRLKKRDIQQNRRTIKRLLNKTVNLATDPVSQEDVSAIERVLQFKARGYNFYYELNPEKKECETYRTDVSNKGHFLYHFYHERFSKEEIHWLSRLDIENFLTKYDIHDNNDQFFFSADLIRLTLDGYSPKDIKALIGLTQGGYAKQRKIAFEMVPKITDNKLQDFVEDFSEVRDHKIFTKKVRDLHYSDEKTKVVSSFCIESVLKNGDTTLNLWINLELIGLDSTRIKASKRFIVKSETTDNDDKIFEIKQNLCDIQKNVEWRAGLERKHYKDLEKEFLKKINRLQKSS